MDKNKKGKSKNKNNSSVISKSKTQQTCKLAKSKAPNNRLTETPTKSTLHLSNSYTQSKSASALSKKGSLEKKKKREKDKCRLLKKRKPKNEKENDIEQDRCDRTLKKFTKKRRDLNCQQNDQWTRQKKQEELTERKKNYLEYFAYREVYIPIENTQQRKIIYKIQLIDQNILRQNKFKANESQEERKQIFQKKDIATQKTERIEQRVDESSQTQTQNKEIQDSCIQSEPERSFVQTLSQIEFLYLPEEKNFTGFTRSERVHYKQLLIFLSKKFDEPETQPLDQDAIELILNQRSMRQRGMIQYKSKTGIPTHTPSIISYISNLFCYIELHQKQNLIDRINCSYGYCSIQKFQRIIKNQNTKIQSQLIPQTTFWRFQSQLHEAFEFESEDVEHSLHAHNRAIFDAVNDILLEYQPYFNSRGQPFPWSYNFETTFYYITEESFSALVTQIKQKIWQHSTTLAGILIENIEQHKYKSQINRILLAQQAIFKSQIKSYCEKEEVQQHKTRLIVDIADLIQAEIIKQIDLLFQC